MTASAVAEREGAIMTPDGRRLAYTEWGPADGSVVLLFHGMPGSRLLCPDVEATGRRRIRLVGVDRPGYGESSPKPGRRIVDWADDARSLLDNLAVPVASVVGWSSGGPYALACAATLGERIRSVAVVAGDAPLDAVPGAFEALPTAVQELIARVRVDGSMRLVRGGPPLDHRIGRRARRARRPRRNRPAPTGCRGDPRRHVHRRGSTGHGWLR
jgi:pimeloyl-ACP methyl ester carboxylesterase